MCRIDAELNMQKGQQQQKNVIEISAQEGQGFGVRLDVISAVGTEPIFVIVITS